MSHLQAIAYDRAGAYLLKLDGQEFLLGPYLHDHPFSEVLIPLILEMGDSFL